MKRPVFREKQLGHGLASRQSFGGKNGITKSRGDFFMNINVANVGYYIYVFVTIGVFIYNCRNLAFLRVTFLYFIFLTFFAFLVIYGSGFLLESNLAQWHKAWLTTFPYILSDSSPDASTISKSSPAYWYQVLLPVIFFLTFPQSVMRSASLKLGNKSKPSAVMGNVKNIYSLLQHAFELFKKHLPFIFGTASNVYDVGEWIFVLVVLFSILSPYPIQNWFLMITGCFFVILLAGSDIVGGKGIVSIILKLLIPGFVRAMQSLAAAALYAVTGILCSIISVLTGMVLYNIAIIVFHTQKLNIYVIIAIICLEGGVLLTSFVLLWKVLKALAKKLLELMEIEILIDESQI